uniref:S-layer homology domain-containing protein n=1 Tax=Faecalicatena contorta TaxID=39482 RepID=UPI00359C8954
MKKRILSILLLCCMLLTLLPTAAFAAGDLPDVKLSVPTTFDRTVDLTTQKKELKIKDSKTYLIKGSADPNWYFQYRIKIDGKNNTPHIFLDGVRLKAPEDGPAIELYGGASACLYFIGNDSELIGAENFAALQKNKTDGYLRVLVRTGTKLTCKGGTYGAGIGGSKVGIKKFSQGHGVNLHFGSLATDIYGGEISATSGPFAAGIGGGANGGVGEQIYVYSGKLTATSVSQGAGIGGGQGGPGRFIYIRGGTVVSSSRSAGAGIGSGDQDGLNEREDAHHIEISGGAVLAFSNYAGAGIGGGRDGSGCDISITGGVVQAQGYFGAGIGGGMNGDSWNILIKDTTLTALAFPLYPSSDYTELSASAVGRGSNRTHYMSAMKNQEDLLYEENIKIGASDGKSVRLSATGWQWRRSQGPYEMDWGTTTELLIPNENGRVDLQRLSLPYAYNYGRVISKLELRCVESTCSHEFGWANRDGCHIWACKNCGARDPAAEMSKQNGKHIPGDWSNQEQFCTVCGHVLERDTKAPVMETLTDGESYTVEDTLDGKPGAYTFTVSDPAASGETSSGVKSVTINGVPQDGPTYRLPAPDGGNNDAGAEYTVVATDNAGNETTATVRTYRRHHEHSYGDWSKDGTSHWHECTDADCPDRDESITDKAAHVYTDDADTTCDVCGYERTVTPPTHEHSYGDWSKDGTSHWHECTDNDCPDRGESIKDKAAHDYTDDADTTCNVCGYERTVTPPSHEHSYGDWRKDGTSHWHECTDDDCPNRNESIKDKAAHDYTDDADTTCDVCGYERTVTPPTHEHSYGDWRKDGTSHWHECTDNDCPDRNESIKDKAAHDYTDDADTTCNVCGYERTVTPPAPTEFIVTFDGNGGTPSDSSMTTTNQKLTSLPSASRSGSYSFDGWYTKKNGGTRITTATVFSANTTVYAHWTYTGSGGGSGYSYYTIKATAGAGGSISPSGNVSVREGRDQTFTITPDKGYAVANVKIDGKSIGAVKSYTFEKVSRTHTIEVIFMKANGNPQTGVFVDVATGSYYEDAVDWAVENGITKGTDDTHFSPDGICTRAQAVTFLWRTAGSPEPETSAMPFTDVPVGSYYYDAVLWAVENGITKGTSDTTFSPDDTCTRAQIVTFLWRSEKSPAAGTANPFADVKSTAYYADAVLWAVKENITKGTTNTTFSPDADCTRAQIVTFLWRCKK